MCAELADLGMQLARAVAAKALNDWREPEAAPAAADPPTDHAAPQASPTPEPAATPLRLAAPCLRAPSCKPVDPALLFTRLTAAVRACIALEARLAGGTAPTSRAASLRLRADPRRALLHETFRRVIAGQPDRAGLLREITIRLDEELTADAGQTIALPDIFFAICEELGIEVDFANLPDMYLNAVTDAIDPAEDATATPYPRATSPP